MTYLMALDQGTTSSRAIVFDGSGAIVALAQREFKQYFPHPGWVEHDAEEIWSSEREVIEETLAAAGLNAADLTGVGITNQRETVVVWERATGKPIYPAIVWQDRRTAEACDRLRAAGVEAMVRERTGLLLDPYFSATKLAWLLENVAGARAAADAGQLACGTIDTWLIYQLTGGKLHVTDVSNASRTLLMNIHSGTWDDDLLSCFGVPRSMLPEIHASSEILGLVDSPVNLAGVPIAGVAGDQQAALFGQACFTAGSTKCTYGTGCFLLMHTGSEPAVSKNKLLSTVAWEVGGATEYALEGSVFVGGAVVAWLRDGLGIIRSSAEVEPLAATVSDSDGVFLVPAFAGLGAPHWDPYARGAILGLTRGTTAAHIARAALDSIAYQVADLVDAMRSDAANTLLDLRVDGGASRNNSLLQFQADILQLPVLRPTVTETTALGAATLAGLATGAWKDRSELAEHWHIDRRFEPKISADRVGELRARWKEAVLRTREWIPAG